MSLMSSNTIQIPMMTMGRSSLSLNFLAVVLIISHSWWQPSQVSAFRPSAAVQHVDQQHTRTHKFPPLLLRQERQRRAPQSARPRSWGGGHRTVCAAGINDNGIVGAASAGINTKGTVSPSGRPPVGARKTTNIVKDCVFKFGGSSLANAERIDHVAKLIKDQINDGFRPRVVVCSAMGKTTTALLQAGREALTTTPTGA